MKLRLLFAFSFLSVIHAQNITTITNTTTTTTTTPIPTEASIQPVKATSPGQLTEAYPSGDSLVPKPEWLDILKNVKIPDGSSGSKGTDGFCDWAKTGCVGTSISDCPKGLWGLTFDDGPSDVSPILYDFLKSTNQKATLFMIGANVIRYPELVKRAFDEGHEIAIHTWTHNYLTKLSNEKIVAELKWTELAIKEITGQSPRLFRPPYGDIDDRVRDIASALGFVSVIWDHDTNDWMLAESKGGFQADWIDGNFSQWISEASTSSTGGLSLEHDIKQVTVDAAIKNLPALQQAYKVVTVGQCANIPPYKESNSILPINTTLPVNATASVLPTSTIAPAPTVIQSPITTKINNANFAVHTSASSLSLIAVFICTLYLF